MNVFQLIKFDSASTKVFHHEQFAIYSMYNMEAHKPVGNELSLAKASTDSIPMLHSTMFLDMQPVNIENIIIWLRHWHIDFMDSVLKQ